jgi:Leucine-rich repeat (LRR) protein
MKEITKEMLASNQESGETEKVYVLKLTDYELERISNLESFKNLRQLNLSHNNI